MKSFHNHLENLQSRAKKLTETALALNSLFAGEETRLNREDEASDLRTVLRAIVEQLERKEYSESLASYGDSKTNLAFSLTGLAAKAVVAATTKSQQARDIVNDISDTITRKKPFGTVMVCIGPKGLPDDASVVSVSQLARESNRTESEIVQRLDENGYLLFSGQVFLSLIDKLVADVRQEKIRLPISRKKLAEIAVLNQPKSRVRIVAIE